MPNDLISTDPIVAQNFYLELDGVNILLSGVSGMDLEYEVVTIAQSGKDGKAQAVKTRGNTLKVGDISLTRMAPMDAKSDPIWKWFHDIRDSGFKGDSRDQQRKNGSIVLFDTALNEVGRFNFYSGWPSKISTDQISTESSEPLKETITLVVERIERIK